MGEVAFDEWTVATDSGARVYVRQVYGDTGASIGVSQSGDEPEVLVELDYDALGKLIGGLDGMRLPRCTECNAPIPSLDEGHQIGATLWCEDCWQERQEEEGKRP